MDVDSARSVAQTIEPEHEYQTPICAFRTIVFDAANNEYDLKIPSELVSILVEYCFNTTNSFAAFHRKENRLGTPSLVRKISTELCEIPVATATEGRDEFSELVGKVIYGFEVHQYPYERPEEGNCLEITGSRSVFLKPSRMSNWVVVDNGKVVNLPARFSYDHEVTSCYVIHRETGPYLHIEMEPTFDEDDPVSPPPAEPVPGAPCPPPPPRLTTDRRRSVEVDVSRPDNETRTLEIFANVLARDVLRQSFHHMLTPNPLSYGTAPSEFPGSPSSGSSPSVVSANNFPEIQLNLPGLHPTEMEFEYDEDVSPDFQLSLPLEVSPDISDGVLSP